jgi:hypothetical protein
VKPVDDIKKYFNNATINTNPQMDQTVLNKVLKAGEKQINPKSASTPNVWRIIMTSKITRLTTAAVIIIAFAVLLQIPGGLLATAYALQDTIEAYNSIRWLHIYEFRTVTNKTRTRESWLACDEQGNMIKMRFQADNVGEPVGPLTITGTSDSSQAWLPRHNLRLLGYGDPGVWLGFDVSELDPKPLIEKLLEQQRRNEVIVDIDEPFWKSKPIVVTVTYPQWTLSENWKKVFYIDQTTKLVKKIEKFKKQDDRFQRIKSIEFCEYNKPIDEMMFTLDRDVPADAKVLDMTEVQAGLPQGDMTDKQIAVEITTQFLQAVIDRDFHKAGQLFLAAPDFLVEYAFRGTNVLKLLSVEQAVPDTDPDSNAMITSCKVLAEFDGQNHEVTADRLYVYKDKDSDRWYLGRYGFSISPAAFGAITLSTEDIDLSAATYNGLQSGEFMHKWLVLGPLPYPVQGDIYFTSKKGHSVAFDTDSLDFVNFTPKVTIDNTDYEWSILESTSGTVDLRQLDKNKNDFQIAYVWAQIEMPEETNGVLGIGSDDGVKVWLNGKLVHENWLYRDVVPDNDRVPVTFRKGTNQLVLKVQNVLGPWGFSCRVLDE